MWHLGSLFCHATQYSQRGWYISNLLLCDIPWNKTPHTGPHHIWLTVCPFFGCEKNTDGSAVGLVISLASVCYSDFCWGLLPLFLLLLFFFSFLKIVFNIASLRTWFWVCVSNQNFTDGFLLKFYFFSQPWLWDNRLPCLHYVWLAIVAETLHLQRYERLLQWQQNRSKAIMWLHIKFQLFEGAQDIFSRLMAVCCMLLPHDPYRSRQQYKRQVCGPSCSCKHWYLWASPIFQH